MNSTNSSPVSSSNNTGYIFTRRPPRLPGLSIPYSDNSNSTAPLLPKDHDRFDSFPQTDDFTDSEENWTSVGNSRAALADRLLEESWKEKWIRLYKTRIRYYIPVLSWAPKYDTSNLKSDMIAGLSVAFLLIPQGLSYAQALVKIPPVHGLYTALVSLFVYCLLGTSRHLAIGPVGTTVSECAMRSSNISNSNPVNGLGVELALKVQLTALLTFMVGTFTLILGFLRLGFLDSVLSRALLRGFVLAVAFVVIIDMSEKLLGLQTPTGQCSESLNTYQVQADPNEFQSPISKLIQVFGNLHHSHLLTSFISFFSIAFLLGIRYLKHLYRKDEKRQWIQVIPDILIVVLVSTVLSWFFRWDCANVAVLNQIKSDGSYNYPKFPIMSVENVRFMMLSAILISVIGFVESIAAAKTYSSKYNYGISPNRELVAMGAANCISSFFGGYPAYGSLGRSAVNDAAGAKTQLAGGISGFIILVVTIWLLPLFTYLPQAVCASIISVAAIKLIEFDDVYFILRMRAWKDLALLLLTFLTTLFISIESGTLVSVGVSLLLVIKHTTKTRIAILGQSLVLDTKTGSFKAKYRSIHEIPSMESSLEAFMVVRIEEGLFFGNSGQLKERLKRIELFGDLNVHPGEEPRCIGDSAPLKLVVFDMAAVSSIDATATQIFMEIVASYHERNIQVAIVKLRDSCKSAFMYSGLYALIGPDRFYRKIQDAIDSELPPDQVEEGSEDVFVSSESLSKKLFE